MIFETSFILEAMLASEKEEALDQIDAETQQGPLKSLVFLGLVDLVGSWKR